DELDLCHTSDTEPDDSAVSSELRLDVGIDSGDGFSEETGSNEMTTHDRNANVSREEYDEDSGWNGSISIDDENTPDPSEDEYSESKNEDNEETDEESDMQVIGMVLSKGNGHTGRFECETCHRWYKSRLWLDRHKCHCDKNEKAFQCEACNKKYSTKQALVQHVWSHAATEEERKRFQCEICGKRFRVKGTLREHMWTHEGNEEAMFRLQCEICEKTFTHRSSLLEHKKRHAKNIEAQRPHRCDKCGKRFHTQNALRIHGITHLPEDDP
ncbi:hypothetical protein PRIPAC_88764, partial [Pristionchus pacificus]